MSNQTLTALLCLAALTSACASTPTRTACPNPRTCTYAEVKQRGADYCVAHQGLIDVHYGRSTAIVVCGDGTTGVVVCCRAGKDA